jgi:WD40 repeat protein
VFELATGKELHRVEHGGSVHAVAFDPKSRWLVTASGRSAGVIDLETGQELYRIEHGDRVNVVRFDPKGRWLATASADGSARLIHADPDYAINLLCARAGRNLSQGEWQTYLPGEPYRKGCDSWHDAEDAP